MVSDVKIAFVVGDRVTHLTDPHGRNTGTVKSYELRGKFDLVEVEWESGVTEKLAPSELRPWHP